MDEAGVASKVGDPDRDYTSKLAAVRREAVELGIPIVSARKFMTEMGFRLDLRTAVQ
jgi:hypothetical protein